METHMWANEATQANVAALRDRGAVIVEPESGELASGVSGQGRLATLEAIGEAIEDALTTSTALAGRRVIVTAGPTLEPIDPVRVVTNRSSGKMGYAIAAAAQRAGAEVLLVAGPTALREPAGVEVIRIETAAELRDAVLAALPGADALVMAAAVADYRPATPSSHKLKKRDQGDEPSIPMTKNSDVLEAVVAERDPRMLVVGFKAETGDAVPEASRMLRDKGLDLVVANDVTAKGSEFGGDTDQVTFVSADGVEALPLLSKREVARRLVAKIAERLAG
jgi:phosphopantothenoylcysteine decarboxylase/phosphopantothenate--cysteine ligase